MSEKSAEYAREVCASCRQAGLRTELDVSSDRIGAKIRAATLMKVPYVLVVGEQELESGEVNVRTREGERRGSCPLPEFLAACAQEIARRGAEAPAVDRQGPAETGRPSRSKGR